MYFLRKMKKIITQILHFFFHKSPNIYIIPAVLEPDSKFGQISRDTIDVYELVKNTIGTFGIFQCLNEKLAQLLPLYF